METTTSTQPTPVSDLSHFFKSVLGPLQDLFSQITSKLVNVWKGSKGAPEDPAHHKPQDQIDHHRKNELASVQLDSASVMHTLRNAAEGLKRICALTEADFLDLGNQLQTIYADSEALTQGVVQLLSSEKNQTVQGALHTIQTHAANAITELNQRRERLAVDLEGLKAIQTDLSALAGQNNNFKQVAKNLKMVGLNISIESARTNEAKSMFQALAEEITQLAQTVYEVAADVSNDTTTAQQNLNAIQADITASMGHLHGLIDSADTTVKEALQEMENLMQLTMHVMDGVGTKAKEINEQVGHLVVGIQIHDNISQRVEHIDTAVDEAVDIIGTSVDIDLPTSAKMIVYGKAYGINRLQRVQLKTIQDDVHEVRNQSATALDKLLEAVQAVAQPDGLELSCGGNVSLFELSNSRHPVMILRRALDQLIALFDEGLDDIRKLSVAREETATTITRMTGHIDRVRDINFDIRLKALNAVIRSTRLGGTGKAIEAIVNEMKELAEQSNDTIQSITDILQSIATASETMDQDDACDTDTQNSAGQLLRNGIDEFSTACVTFRDQSADALGKGSSLQSKIAKARQRIGFFDRLLQITDKHLDDFTRIDTLLNQFAHAVPDDWIEEEQKIIKRYTMQRERDAHEKILNSVRNAKDDIAEKVAASVRDTQVSQQIDEGDLGDNIELF